MLDKLKNRLIKANTYSDLFSDEKFQIWKREVVEKRLESYKNEALNTDPDSDAHKKAIIRYQELKYITDGVFKVWKAVEDNIRKQLEESS